MFIADNTIYFKVSRNFELVGWVNLDQLEQMKGKTESSSSDEEEKELSCKTEKRGQYSAFPFLLDTVMDPDSSIKQDIDSTADSLSHGSLSVWAKWSFCQNTSWRNSVFLMLMTRFQFKKTKSCYK